MALGSRIKGITIEFDGDTTKLGKALRQVDKESKGVDQSLREVNRALKFNPNNTELLAQKQGLLKSKIDETKKRLDVLREAQAKLDDDPSVDNSSQEYQALRREIIQTESKLNNLRGEAKKLGNVKLTALGNQFKSVGKKMQSAGSTLTRNLTLPLIAGYTASANLASDYEENLNKIDVAFGKNSDEVKKWSETALETYGMSRVQATSAASAFGALGKGIGIGTKDAAEMSTTLAGLSADLGSYFNTSTEDSAKALEGIFTGESEALKKFGVVMTDTNLEKFASDQGLVWKEMDQTEKTMLRYNFVLAQTKDAQGDFSRTSDGTANSIKMFQASIQELGTTIGANLLPIITPIVQKITEWVKKFGELDPKTQKIITIMGIAAAALGPVLTIIGSMATGVGALMSVAGKLTSGIGALSKVFTLFTGPVGIAIAAIAAAIAAGVLLYKNWDKIKAKAAELKEWVVARVKGIKDGIGRVFEGLKKAGQTYLSIITWPYRKAWELIKRIVDKIKGVFNFKFKIPKIKLPHFAINPKGWKLSDLLQGSIPSLGIDWYANGGIFNKPTVAGVGDVRGGEAAVPLTDFYNRLDAMADSIVNGVSMALQMQSANAAGEITIPIYLYPSGPKMGEETVKTYDKYKKIMG